MSRAATPPDTLLAGATGLVGRALLAELLAQGRTVHALVRRTPPDWPRHARLHTHTVDWAAAGGLPALPPAREAFCALGTTIKVAGSEAAFRAVDLDAVLAFAHAAKAAGVERLGVVSALGADARSAVFYNRVKGEAEAALAALGLPVLVLARPSLLVGDRSGLGQPERQGERWAQRLSGPLSGLIPARWRPVEASVVARALVRAVSEARPGRRVVESAELQTLGR